jgi:hypothetical protein
VNPLDHQIKLKYLINSQIQTKNSIQIISKISKYKIYLQKNKIIILSKKNHQEKKKEYEFRNTKE